MELHRGLLKGIQNAMAKFQKKPLPGHRGLARCSYLLELGISTGLHNISAFFLLFPALFHLFLREGTRAKARYKS